MPMNKCKHKMVCEYCQTDCQYFTEYSGFTRLTVSGNRLCNKCANAATCEIDQRFAGKEKCLLEQIYERLSEYEDAGLTPMQIKELLEENKMRKTVSDCQGCAADKGCRGRRCPYYSRTVYECDRCKDEINPEDVLCYQGKDYCADCVLTVLLKNGIIEAVED